MCVQFSTKQQHNSQLAAGLHPEKLHLVDYGLQKALTHMCLYYVFPGTKMDHTQCHHQENRPTEKNSGY